MSINLDGVLLGTKYVIEAMKTTGGGSIINMSSIEGIVGDSRMAAYDSSKGGLRTLTKSAISGSRTKAPMPCFTSRPTNRSSRLGANW